MLQSELRELIKIEITGKLVEFELADEDLDRIIQDAVRRVKSWYVEGFHFETILLSESTEGTAYFEESDLAATPGYIEDILGADPGQGSDLSGISLVTNLLGLPADILYYAGTGYDFGDVDYSASAPGASIFDDWFITYSQYVSVRPSIENMMPMYEWEWVSPKVYVSGVSPGETHITVVYAHDPANFEEMTINKAISWVQDFAIAKTKVALGRARGKFRSGGLNFETDAAELVSEGNEAIRELKEQLKMLDFNPAIER